MILFPSKATLLLCYGRLIPFRMIFSVAQFFSSSLLHLYKNSWWYVSRTRHAYCKLANGLTIPDALCIWCKSVIIYTDLIKNLNMNICNYEIQLIQFLINEKHLTYNFTHVLSVNSYAFDKKNLDLDLIFKNFSISLKFVFFYFTMFTSCFHSHVFFHERFYKKNSCWCLNTGFVLTLSKVLRWIIVVIPKQHRYVYVKKTIYVCMDSIKHNIDTLVGSEKRINR